MEIILIIVFAELVLCINEVSHHDVERAAMFELSDVAQLYTLRTNGATWNQSIYQYNKTQTTFVT